MSYCCKWDSICSLFFNPLPLLAEEIGASSSLWGCYIELWRHRGDVSDSLFHSHTVSDIISTEVQRIHWCMALLSRSQLNELISAATIQSALFTLTCVTAYSQRIMSECKSDCQHTSKHSFHGRKKHFSHSVSLKKVRYSLHLRRYKVWLHVKLWKHHFNPVKSYSCVTICRETSAAFLLLLRGKL